MRRLMVTVLLLLSLVQSAWAQADCFPPKDSHEAQVFAALAVPLAFSLVEGPGPSVPGAVRIGLEVTYIPGIDSEIRTPTICRPGKGPEHTDLLSVLPRPRVSIGLPAGLLLEASWVPPISLHDVKSNLFGLSLQRGFALGREAISLTVRAHAAFGVIEAPITCNDEALADPTSECFQGTRSNDRYHPNTFGAEGVLSWVLGPGKVRPFVGGGLNILRPRFQVNFTNQFGETDNRKVEVDLTRGVLFAGATWVPSHALALTGEIYSAPTDAVTGRVAISYGI